MRRLDSLLLVPGVYLASVALVPSQAMAHPVTVTASAFAGGMFHSFGGLDHALAMIGVGLLSTRLQRFDIFLLPATFLVFLALGAGVGYSGLGIRFAESAVAISCLALGSCILSPRLQRYRSSIFGIVASFAAVHGYVHLAELPAGFDVGQYTIGFICASAIMHLIGVFIGEAFRDREHLWLVHILGAAMVVFGSLFLIRSLRTEAPVAPLIDGASERFEVSS